MRAHKPTRNRPTGNRPTGNRGPFRHGSGFFAARILAGALFAGVSFHALPSHALSELQKSDVPPSDTSNEIERAPLDDIVPNDEESTPENGAQPAPAVEPGLPVTPVPDDSDDEETGPSSDLVRPDITANEKPPEIIYDIGRLPEPVRRMRELIIEACKSGEVEKLRPLVGAGPDATQLSLGPLEGDPIAFLRELSGDDQGQEILAILLEVMQSGFVHLNVGEPSEIYAWPYFFAVPLKSLTPQQRVELFKLVTAGDYEDMKSFGAYIFYRAAITPEGKWLFFVAGD